MTPSAILGDKRAIARVRSLARRSGYYTRSEDAFGRPVENHNGVPFVDLGDSAYGLATVNRSSAYPPESRPCASKSPTDRCEVLATAQVMASRELDRYP